jgi:hypothetical protein
LILVVTRIDEPIKEPLRQTIIELIERLPVIVSGFNNNLTVEVKNIQSTSISAVATDVKDISYEPIVPKFVYRERYGKAVENAFQCLINQNIQDGVTFDVMVIEPDATHTQVVSAWHCTEMWVNGLKTSESKRDVTALAINQATSVEVTFDCKVTRGMDVLKKAKEILVNIQVLPAFNN